MSARSAQRKLTRWRRWRMGRDIAGVEDRDGRMSGYHSGTSRRWRRSTVVPLMHTLITLIKLYKLNRILLECITFKISQMCRNFFGELLIRLHARDRCRQNGTIRTKTHAREVRQRNVASHHIHMAALKRSCA